jgi:hypothetical protein
LPRIQKIKKEELKIKKEKRGRSATSRWDGRRFKAKQSLGTKRRQGVAMSRLLTSAFLLLTLVDVGEGDGGDGDSESKFGGVNGAGGVWMFGQFFGDGFRELRTEMPEKGMAPRTEQAHEAVTDQDKAGKLQESLLHKVRIKN